MALRLLLASKIVILVFSLCFALESTASEKSLSESSVLCLGCHGSMDLTLQLKGGEKLSLYIDEQSLKNSVHGMLDCSGCHTGFSADKHPARILNTKRDYAVSGSALCRGCHTKFKTELHSKMADMAKKGGKLCVDCHGAHYVQRTSKKESRDSNYCLGCHKNELTMTFRDGEKLSVHIDPELLNASVHKKLYCSDCHFGFSPEEHPHRKFKSKKDYTIAASESCRRCHFDKYTKTLESIHYTMLSQGNLLAPVCVDCHGSHAVAPTGKERTLSAKRCQKCHGDIYKIYSESVHGSALFNEHNQDVPVCVDCHRAHNIEDPRTFNFREQIPQMCGNCHANKELMDKYGLTTAVINTYLQDFHGITLKLYKKQKDYTNEITLRPIAVCIDCHGIHDITITTGPNSSIVKTNLVKRCRKCHPNATENFPDSWISHYKPSPQKAPLVFIINLFYKIFIPFMMIGLILQILLHIWRYAINR